MPSSSGEPGGAPTGEHMMDYVVMGGRFMSACQQLVERHYSFPWIDCFPVVRQAIPVTVYRRDNTPVELEKSLKPKSNEVEIKGSDTPEKDNAEPCSVDDKGNLMPWDKIETSQLPVFHSTKPVQKSGKVKYSCKKCKSNVWGKPNLNIGCLDCNQNMMATDMFFSVSIVIYRWM